MTTTKKQIFTYAVLLHKFDKEGNYTDSQMIIEPKIMLAKTQKDVIFKVTREIPEEYTQDPDNVEILVRGF